MAAFYENDDGGDGDNDNDDEVDANIKLLS